jgi:hypothetical protein
VNSPTNFAGVEGSVDASVPCSDGLDNDGDGAVDFGADPGCASADDPDGSERDSTGTYPCDDELDDDGDGYTDAPEDPACQGPSRRARSRRARRCHNDGQPALTSTPAILAPAGRSGRPDLHARRALAQHR